MYFYGEVTEWFKVHAWNACVRKYREFESHLLRQILIQLNPGQAEKCFLARDLQKRFVRVRLKKAIDNPPFGGYFWGYETPCQE